MRPPLLSGGITLFALASLGFYLKGRMALAIERKRAAIFLCLSMFPFALLSVLSKENGALLLLLIVIFELSIFREAQRTQFFKIWYRIAVQLPLIIVFGYLLITFSTSMEGYDYRHFGLLERLLTESRVLLSYLSRILIPTSMSSSLYHDDLRVSQSLIQPVSTLLSLLILFALAVLALVFRKNQPMLFFGIAWFFAMHFLETSYLPLELYFEHRNYMAMIGPLITMVWYIFVFVMNDRSEARVTQVSVVLLLFFLSISWQTWQRAKLWGNAGDLVTSWAYENPDSSRAKIALGDFLFANDAPEQGFEYIDAAHDLLPNEVTIMLHRWNKSCEYQVNPPYGLDQIAAMEEMEYFHNDIIFHLQGLLDNVRGAQCNLPPLSTLASLFDRISTLPLSDSRKANVHILYSELFAHFRILDPALIELGKARDIFPDLPSLPMRQAMLSASAGNYADAMVFLDRARQADSRRGFFDVSLEEEIVKLEAEYRRQL